MSGTRPVSVMLIVGLVSGLSADEGGIPSAAVKDAVAKAIPLLERGSAGSVDQRQCFTCHNQAIPILALTEAGKRGFAISRENLDRQLRHTAEHLARGREKYREGVGQGGNVITAGYALWALEAGGWQADETTEAVTSYLLEHQQQSDHWKHRGNRPPSSGSDFTATAVALRGLAAFGTEEQQTRIDERTATVRPWLLNEPPSDTEDHVFRLWALRQVHAAEQEINQAVEELILIQRSDGGWAQTAERASDAYATGTALAVLRQACGVPVNHPVIERGAQYLLDTQQRDGSWHVVSRADPFQEYYESGFPHEDDQFISMAASSWSTLALVLILPELP